MFILEILVGISVTANSEAQQQQFSVRANNLVKNT